MDQRVTDKDKLYTNKDQRVTRLLEIMKHAPFKNKNSRSTYQNPFQILNHKCHTAKHPEQEKRTSEKFRSQYMQN